MGIWIQYSSAVQLKWNIGIFRMCVHLIRFLFDYFV